MELTFNRIEKGQYEKVSKFIIDMYNHHLRRYYTDEGNAEYLKFASASELERRNKAGNLIFVVMEDDAEMVGIIEFDKKKLHQFFIVDEFRGRGYGRMAINWISDYFGKNKMGKSLVVEASPNAYIAFEKMGFEAVDEEQGDGQKVFKRMKLNI